MIGMKNLCSMFLVTAVSFILPACAGHLDRKTQLRELMELSGLQKQVNQVPAHALSFLKEEEERLPPDQCLLLSRVFHETYDEEKLLQGVQAGIEKNFDSEFFIKTLKWMRSPLARRITKLEVESSSPEALKQMQALAEQLLTKPAPDQRMKLIRQLDAATHGTEMATDMVILNAWGIEIGLNALLLEERRSGPETLLSRTAFAHQQMIKEQKELMQVSLLYTYQTLTDSELERYAAFAESDAGQWYYRTIRIAFKDVLSEAALNIGKCVERGLPGPP